ncbi:SDR family oxidoreductase [Amycolatopsis acidiphila]|uniref:SDR family oxidoreductase n=1 Tax=Amycolatopsis acidiphila TaxID=715473 RepID=A0A558A5B0_9PSEU|nr:SDR family oxidoreductase [Amycolatopsis acidiphila]TVT19435.1 SDR family oxidoreductase [Amycolatopsis acidiphila]UIJ56755.1 SDR family oxidoreductase [Amycolatopsis acidiphila]GHG55319.1 short-chain dehydrogenase [Amycolatopsis acidiphila]
MDNGTHVAVVTGASRGLGLALTRELVRRGWRVIADARDGDRLDAALSGLTGVTRIPGDVTDPGHRGEIAESAPDGVDLLVNNASALGPSPQPALAGYPLAELERVYAVNTIAPLALIQLLLPGLRRRRGRIIDISSDAAVEPYEGWGGYGSAKAALDQLTAILAAEEPAVRVYACDPGDMNTDLHQQAFPGEDISDRPAPESVVPALLRLVERDLPSGRYQASAIPV